MILLGQVKLEASWRLALAPGDASQKAWNAFQSRKTENHFAVLRHHG